MPTIHNDRLNVANADARGGNILLRILLRVGSSTSKIEDVEAKVAAVIKDLASG